jgi:predicted nucleic acid-binding protein
LTRYVLDASVAAKWFLPPSDETLSAEAFALLRQYGRAQVDFLVPDLFFPEFANILWKAERHRRCDAATADAALEEVLRRGLPTFPTSPLIQPAIQIARAYNRTVHDCVYIALAIETNTQVITADEKLANYSAGLPVTWLGLI